MKTQAHHLSKRSKQRGFSLADFVVGAFIIILIMTGSVSFMKHLSTGSVRMSLAGKAAQELNSASERLYIEAAQNFSNMTATNRDVTSDPDIKILATIQEVEPNTRTRFVTLTAQWGPALNRQSKTIEFRLSQTRSMENAASVKVLVIKDNDEMPAPGVVISVPGNDGYPISAVTDSAGIVVLNGAKVSATGINVTANGSTIRAFFQDASAYTFIKDFPLARTTAGIFDETYFTNPIRVLWPGQLKGRVLDINGAAVANASVEVGIITSLIPYTLSTAESKTVTNTNGDYNFNTLLPGRYAVWMHGNADHVGLGRSGDGSWMLWNGGPNNDKVDVGPAGSVTKNYTTIRKAALEGKAYGITYSGGQYVKGAALPAGFLLRAYRYGSSPYTTPVSGILDLYDTNSWRRHNMDLDGLTWNRAIFPTGASGNYSVTNLGPSVMHPDFDLNTQMAKVSIRAANVSRIPAYLPVIVAGPTAGASFPQSPANVNFAVSQFSSEAGGNSPQNGMVSFYPLRADVATAYPLFDTYLRPNGLDHPLAAPQQDYSIYVLESNVLSNIDGQLLKSDGSAWSGDQGVVSICRADGSLYGGFTRVGVLDSGAGWDGTKYPDYDAQGVTFSGLTMYTFNWGGGQWYNFGGSYPKPFLPTVGNEQIHAKFAAASTPMSKLTQGSLVVKKRVAANGNAADWETVNASEADYTNIVMRTTLPDNCGLMSYTNTHINDAAISMTVPTELLGVTAVSAPFTLTPDPTSATVPLHRANITIPDGASSQMSDLLVMVNDPSQKGIWMDPDQPKTYCSDRYERYTYDSGTGKYVGPTIKTRQFVTLGAISVLVRDVSDNQRIVGAEISLQRSGWDHETHTTVAAAGPGGAYSFYATGKTLFPMTEGNDVRIIIKKTGFDDVAAVFTGYDGRAINVDVLMNHSSGGDDGGENGGGL